MPRHCLHTTAAASSPWLAPQRRAAKRITGAYLAAVLAQDDRLVRDKPTLKQLVQLLAALRHMMQICHLDAANEANVARFRVAVATVHQLLPMVFTGAERNRSTEHHAFQHLAGDLAAVGTLAAQSADRRWAAHAPAPARQQSAVLTGMTGTPPCRQTWPSRLT
jgi:hypothetical protein